MKSIMKNTVGAVVDLAIGGAVMKTVGDSNMPQGFKDVTNIGISAGIASRAIGRFSNKKKGKFNW